MPEASGTQAGEPLERRFRDERGEQLGRTARYGRPPGRAASGRRAALDELVLRLVQRERVDTVLVLAAGLDTRCYRLPLPATLRWVEADEPAILAYKAERLADLRPACALERLPLDLADVAGRNALFAQVNQGAGRVLVVSEGCLAYLVPERVALIAQDLHAQPRFRWWLLDLLPAAALRGPRPAQAVGGRAPWPALRFAPATGPAFFAHHGWLVAEVRPLHDSPEQRTHGQHAAPRWWWIRRAMGQGRGAAGDIAASVVALERA